MMVGAFDERNTVEPSFHIFAEHRLPWLCLSDDLTRYRTTPSDGGVMG
jgi:hypothetical protein